jgi:hypothetical protein
MKTVAYKYLPEMHQVISFTVLDEDRLKWEKDPHVVFNPNLNSVSKLPRHHWKLDSGMFVAKTPEEIEASDKFHRLQSTYLKIPELNRDAVFTCGFKADAVDGLLTAHRLMGEKQSFAIQHKLIEVIKRETDLTRNQFTIENIKTRNEFWVVTCIVAAVQLLLMGVVAYGAYRWLS